MAIITDQHLPSVLVDAAELPPIYWIDSGRPVGKSANRFHRLTGTGVEILTPTVFALEMSTNTNPAAPTNISSAAPQTATPTETQLLANYPNPFNPETWIPYQLAKDTDVQLLIYDMHGKIVRSLTLEHQFAGYYTNSSRAAYWDGRNALGERVASGVYFYQLLTTETSLIRKMVILK